MRPSSSRAVRPPYHAGRPPAVPMVFAVDAGDVGGGLGDPEVEDGASDLYEPERFLEEGEQPIGVGSSSNAWRCGGQRRRRLSAGAFERRASRKQDGGLVLTWRLPGSAGRDRLALGGYSFRSAAELDYQEAAHRGAMGGGGAEQGDWLTVAASA